MSAMTRQCQECTREFEWSGIGRPPVRCNDCKSEEKERAAAKRSEPAAPAKKTRRVVMKKPRAARKPTENGTNGKGSIKRMLADLRHELEELQERESHLQEAIDAMERLA